MGILSKLFSGGASKYQTRLKQLDRLLDTGKLEESSELLAGLAAELRESGPKDELAELENRRLRLFNAYLADDKLDAAFELAAQCAEDEPEVLDRYATALAERNQGEPRALRLMARAVTDGGADKRILLNTSKRILDEKGEALGDDERSFIELTVKAYPLWRDGLSVLADRYLREDRRDTQALAVYRGAYPNRKADLRLREVLLESLVVNEERDDFAAEVYKDAVETSENPDALRLLAEYYLEKREFSPATLPYIERALRKAKLGEDALKQLNELILRTRQDFVNRTDLLLAIYRQGYADRDLLIYLSNALAEASRFDDESIEIMTQAFELRMVSKRAILILTEHCLANDRADEFAVRVYESYLSTWPDRPQRRIYGALAHHYADLTRVDEQAQKIYEEALVDSPTDTLVVTILARAYHAADRRDSAAERVYRHAFSLVDGEVKIALATLLAEMRVAVNDYNEETLQYLTVMGRPESGPLKDKYDEALTSCFLATGRRGEQAQQAYFALFRKTEDTRQLNPRLVSLLAEIIRERGEVPAPASIEMRVYYKLFELEKFSTASEVAFVLFEHELGQAEPRLNLIHLSVRCFEADAERFLDLLKEKSREPLLQEIGDFYIEHYNFPQAAKVYQASYELSPTDQIRYRLAKIQLMDGRGKEALEHLRHLDSPDFAQRRQYWEAVAYQTLGQPAKSTALLQRLPLDGEVPLFLVNLRDAINLELEWQKGKGKDNSPLVRSLEAYAHLAETRPEEYAKFDRWLQLQRGIVLLKLERLEDARDHLEDVHRRNPNGRAEQLFYSLALFMLAHQMLRAGNLDLGLPMFTRAVEVNRNDRLLRQVIVEILSLYGERAFFDNQLKRAAKLLEVAHRILPKRVETKTFLAYTYHRMEDFVKAIIYYRDISWEDENPRLERSQAYAYMAQNQAPKAWRVFLDLARRENLLKENFPRLVACFLTDEGAAGGRAWERVEFATDVDGLLLVALLLHDGLYQRAADELTRLIDKDRDNLQMRWYLGRAYSHLGKRDLAVHNWKELLRLCSAATVGPEAKIRQFTEIGLAFIAAGYSQEAMQTWEELRQIDEENPDLAVLYAATLDLNGYHLARKDQLKLARTEWKKALEYDPDNPQVIQNYAIANLLLDDYEEATHQFAKLSEVWQSMLREAPKRHGDLHRGISVMERAMNTLALTKGRPEFDLTKVRAEDRIDYLQKANQFYWILGLDKRANRVHIENEYFRLIKIFNPERHADDFMLVEESYASLLRDPDHRAMLDLFVFNPVDPPQIRERLTRIPRGAGVSFEQLNLLTTVPPPDYQQLVPPKGDEGELARPLHDLLAINSKIPDWTVL